jgi:hypothetical protein
MGGSKITGFHSTEYRSCMVDQLTRGEKGKADLSGYFLLIHVPRFSVPS